MICWSVLCLLCDSICPALYTAIRVRPATQLSHHGSCLTLEPSGSAGADIQARRDSLAQTAVEHLAIELRLLQASQRIPLGIIIEAEKTTPGPYNFGAPSAAIHKCIAGAIPASPWPPKEQRQLGTVFVAVVTIRRIEGSARSSSWRRTHQPFSINKPSMKASNAATA